MIPPASSQGSTWVEEDSTKSRKVSKGLTTTLYKCIFNWRKLKKGRIIRPDIRCIPTPYEEKNLGPLYTVVLDPAKNDLSSEGHLTKELFFAVFGTFT
jgi:hypothetical protein